MNLSCDPHRAQYDGSAHFFAGKQTVDYSTSSESEEIEHFMPLEASAVAMTEEEHTQPQDNQESRQRRAPIRDFCRLDGKD